MITITTDTLLEQRHIKNSLANSDCCPVMLVKCPPTTDDLPPSPKECLACINNNIEFKLRKEE